MYFSLSKRNPYGSGCSMKIDFEGAKIYVRPGSTDLRKGVSGLLAISEIQCSFSAIKATRGYNKIE